jgi:hypothetical protein
MQRRSRKIRAIQVAMANTRFDETLPGQPAGESNAAFSGISDPLLHQVEVLRERIYHEDSLLGTRSYNLLTAQAFLVSALAGTISGQVARHQRQITLLIAILGLSMGLIYGVVTIGTLSSIAFWRDKLRELEGLMTIQPWIPFDANLEATRGGTAPVRFGLLRISGINRLLSWIVPLLLFSFWVGAIVWICCSVR